MNPHLLELLRAAGVSLPDTRAAMSRVIVVNNDGCVPSLPGLPHGFALRGFKVIVLGPGGAPVSFVRCGDSRDELLRRETEILVTLQGAPEVRRVIPAVRAASDGRVQVQVNEFVRGRSYLDLVRRQSPGAWRRSTREILDASALVANAAAVRIAWLLPPSPLADVGPLVERDAGVLERSGIPAGTLRSLVAAMAGVPSLPVALQHGDLWPGNVLQEGSHWRLIDFAEFGHVHVPLYDVCHLMSFRPDRAKGSGPWFADAHGVVRDAWAAVAAETVRARAQQLRLTDLQMGAALVYYFVHIAAYRFRPGVPTAYVEHILRSLQTVSDFLERGGGLSNLVSRLP